MRFYLRTAFCFFRPKKNAKKVEIFIRVFSVSKHLRIVTRVCISLFIFIWNVSDLSGPSYGPRRPSEFAKMHFLHANFFMKAFSLNFGRGLKLFISDHLTRFYRYGNLRICIWIFPSSPSKVFSSCPKKNRKFYFFRWLFYSQIFLLNLYLGVVNTSLGLLFIKFKYLDHVDVRLYLYRSAKNGFNTIYRKKVTILFENWLGHNSVR